MALPIPLAAPVTSATRVGQRLRLRHPRELGLLERPVLDAELLALVDRRVGRDRLGAAHHVDRVDVELAGDAGGLLVRAEAEHADAGHQHDRRVGAAHRRAVRGRVPLVVGGVLGAVLRVQLLQPRDDVLDRGVRRQVDDQRADLGAQEVVGAGRAQRGQPRVLDRGEEVEDDVGVGEVPDLRLVGAREAADHRRQRGGLDPPLGVRQRLVAGQRRTERLGPAALGEEALRRPDDLQGVGLALLAGVAPRGDAVAAEDAADRLRVLLRDLGDVQAQLEARAAATAPRRRGRRSTPGSAPRRRPRWPGRCPSRGAGGRRARRGPARASRCRSTGPRRPGRAGSSRTRRPSRPRGRRPGRRRPASAAGPAAARRGPASVSVPRSPPEPLTHSSSTGCPVTGSVSVPLAEVLPPA